MCANQIARACSKHQLNVLFGNGVISNTHANNLNGNNFIGFVPSVISTPPIGGGGANLPPSLNSSAPSFSLAPPASAVAPPLKFSSIAKCSN